MQIYIIAFILNISKLIGMKLKNKLLLPVAALSIVATFSFGLVANVAFSKTEETQVSASADQGTWTITNNRMTFSYRSGTSRAFVNRTEQTAVNGFGHGKYAITYQVWGYSSGAMKPEEDLLETIELQFIWGNCVDSDNYGTITAYPVDIPGLSSTDAVSLEVLVQPTGTMELTYPTYVYNPKNRNFDYYLDAGTVLVTQLQSVTYHNFGEGNERNFARLNIDVYQEGSVIRTDTMDLDNAVLIEDSTVGYTVTGYYFDQPVNDLVIGNTECKVVDINDGYNYLDVYHEIIEYNSAEDTLKTVVIQNAVLNSNENIITIDAVLRDYDGIETNIESFTLTNATSEYNEDLQRYMLSGICSLSGMPEGDPITIYSSVLEVEGTWMYSSTYSEFIYSVPGEESPRSRLSSSQLATLYLFTDRSLSDLEDDYFMVYYDALTSTGTVKETRGFIVLDASYTTGSDAFTVNGTGWRFDDSSVTQEDQVSITVPTSSVQIACDNLVFDSAVSGFKYVSREYPDESVSDISASYNVNNSTIDVTVNIVTPTGETLTSAVASIRDYHVEKESDGYVISGVWGVQSQDVTIEVPTIGNYYNYEIVFDGNGATSGEMAPVTLEGESYSFEYTLPECNYEKTGYNFAGWALNPDETSMIYPAGSTQKITGDTIFYAIWEAPKTTYTISFDANGGTGTMQSVEVSAGVNTVPSCDFVRDGYDFNGWAVGSPNGPVYQTGEQVNVDDNYILYATWVEKTTPTPGPTLYYKITFKGNGATGGRMNPMNCAAGENVVPECGFTKDGYVFVGWAVDSLDSRIIVQPGDRVNVDKNYTLYALWEKRIVEWRYNDTELSWYDSGAPEDWAEPKSAVFYEGATQEENIAFVTYSILRFEPLNEPISSDTRPEEPSPIVVREITITFKSATTTEDGEYVYIEGLFEEVGEIVSAGVLAENFKIGQTEGRNITPAQEAEIRNNIPVDQNPKVDESLEVLPDETATEIISVIGSTNSAIDADSELTPEEKEEAYSAVKKAIEASVVVGAQQSTATEDGETINEVLPVNSTIDMSDTLNEFYERQMDVLLGRGTPNRIHFRAPNNEENTIDYTIPEEDYGKMISYVDTSVENMTDAALQLRNCSGIEMIAVVETYIQKVLVSSFREYDKEAADEEFVAQAYESIMKTMQQQVLEILEKEHQPSNNPEKEAQYNETIEAVKDYETFEQMVIEVLRQKYVSATGQEVDIDTFEGMYMDIFRAWALDEPELNPHGITLEELTNATIEVTTNKANHMTFNAKFSKGENIFLIVFGSVTALSIAGAIAIPTILKKKREGVSK